MAFTYLSGFNVDGNVGIGTGSPSFGTGGGLQISDASQANLRFTDTSNATFITDLALSNENFYIINRSASGQLKFRVNASTEAITIVNTGNVGIGTTAPQTKLQVDGDISVKTGDAYRMFNTAGTGWGEMSLNEVNNRIEFNRGINNSGSDWLLSENSVNSYVSANAGNFGIGTTSPTEKLHIKSTVSGSFIRFEDNGGSGVYVGSRSNELEIYAGGSERMKIDAAGAIQFNAYNDANNTGTPTYLLGTDGSGNIVKTNTVPGSAAGPYLPLAGGTLSGNLKLNDDVQLNIGSSGSDLRLVHSSNNSYIQNFVGDLQISNYADDKDILFRCDDGAGGLATYFFLDGGSVATQFNQRALFIDNIAAEFGSSRDLKIYHDGSNSYIDDTGTGGLVVKTGDFYLRNPTNADMIYATSAGAVNLYHNGTKKFETTSTGVTVTGALSTTDDITIDNSSPELYFKTGATHYSWMVAAQENVNQTFEITPSTVVGGTTFSTPALKINGSDSSSIFTGTVTSPTFLGDLNGTINTVTTAVTKANATNDTTVATTAFVQNLIGTIPAGLVFQGTWNASTNTPTLASGTGTTGYFYIVSTSGSTNLDGVTDWVTGDWAVFIEQGGTDAWEKIDNSSVLDGAGTGQTLPLWSGSGTSNTLTDSRFTQAATANRVTSPGNASTDSALEVQNASATNLLRVRGNGIVEIPGNYLHVNASSGAYIDGLLRARGGVTDDSSTLGLGGSGSITNLTLTSNTTATFAGDVKLSVAKKLYFGGGDHTYIGEDVDDRLRFFTGGAEFMRFTEGTTDTVHLFEKTIIENVLEVDDKVGIGIVPVELLDIQSASGDARIRLDAPSGSDTEVKFFNAGVAQYTIGHDDATDNFVIGGVNVDAPLVSVDKTGNVGIGTTSPTFKLHVNSTDASDNVAYIHHNNAAQSSGDVLKVRSDAGDNAGSALLNVANNTGTALYVRGDRNVGIGTAAPGAKFEVSGGDILISNGQYYTAKSTSGVNYKLAAITTGNVVAIGAIDYTSAGTIFAGGDNVSITTGGVAGSSRLKILSNGNVGIGTTTPSSKLQVDGGIQMADDTDTAVAGKVGTVRYRTSGNNSYVDMCMQTGASTYEWINIVQNNW